VVLEACVAPLRLYRLMLSPLLPRSCRFEPTCSAYAIEAVVEHGIARGGWLALRRLGRCHPACEAGFDPVPARQEA
jgi:putative membrane protein insertion efficiency factor